jgi:hypothetical protein
LEIVWHFRVRFQEKQLQVTRFILELHLRAIGKDIAHAPLLAEQT